MQNERDTKYLPFARVLWQEIVKDYRIQLPTVEYTLETDARTMAQDFAIRLLTRANAIDEVESPFHDEMSILIARKLYEWREHGWDQPGWPPD